MKLFQSLEPNCKACNTAAWDRAEAEGGKSVAPIFAGTQVAGAEYVACEVHTPDLQMITAIKSDLAARSADTQA